MFPVFKINTIFLIFQLGIVKFKDGPFVVDRISLNTRNTFQLGMVKFNILSD